MRDSYLFQIRVTGVLIEDNKILLVKQRVSEERNWSLPGGRLEHGESIEKGLIREIQEETGLIVEISKLLYVCEKTDIKYPLIHMTFLLNKISGDIKMPSNEFDENTIYDVKMVPVNDLENYGFSQKFKKIVKEGFLDAGNYMGAKASIGL